MTFSHSWPPSLSASVLSGVITPCFFGSHLYLRSQTEHCHHARRPSPTIHPWPTSFYPVRIHQIIPDHTASSTNAAPPASKENEFLASCLHHRTRAHVLHGLYTKLDFHISLNLLLYRLTQKLQRSAFNISSHICLKMTLRKWALPSFIIICLLHISWFRSWNVSSHKHKPKWHTDIPRLIMQ